MIKLREYQKEIYEKTKHAFAKGSRSVLIVAPCGSGKSYIFAKMASNATGNVLVLAHRKELLIQHEKLFSQFGIHARFNTIQTEVNHMMENGIPDFLIVDEAHLSMSNSWIKVIETYNTFTVGFTGSPIRLDGKPLGSVYDSMIKTHEIKWFIEHKMLAPYEYYAPMSVNIDLLRTSHGDYNILDIEELMCKPKLYSDIVKSYQRFLNGEKTIVYCATIKHSKHLANEFCKNGIKAIHLDAANTKKDRERQLELFVNGEIKVLCNVGLFSEGISIDDVVGCMLCRPTQSLALNIQQSMRCMRYQEKKIAKIVDCVGNYTRHGLPDEDREWSLEKTLKSYPRFNDKGEFAVRVCKSCYMTYRSNTKICPYCGAVYTHSKKEIENMKNIELVRIQEQEIRRIKEEKKKMRIEQGNARTFLELVRLGEKRGYKNPGAWASMVLRGRK